MTEEEFMEKETELLKELFNSVSSSSSAEYINLKKHLMNYAEQEAVKQFITRAKRLNTGGRLD